jgi:hypothetical protein
MKGAFDIFREVPALLIQGLSILLVPREGA